MNLNTGEVLNDRYTILSKVGEGGFACIYHAYDNLLSRDLAIKALKTSVFDDDNSVRFIREAKMLASLSHKNIVAVFAFDLLPDKTPIILMEYLTGSSLRSYLSEKDTVSADDLLEILRQCCQGLSYLHDASIIHRDLSPANIFLLNLQSNIELKILDFGLSKTPATTEQTVSHLTKTGTILGNPPYMSPEAAAGGKVDLRSDLYSLGCIIYECLTGKNAFTADNNVGVIYKQLHEYPAEPFNSSASEECKLLSQIALRCLQKDPAKRFQSCREIINIIENKSSVMFPVGYHGWDGMELKNDFSMRASILFLCAAALILSTFSFWVNRMQIPNNNTNKKPDLSKKVRGQNRYKIERLLVTIKRDPHDLQSLDKLLTIYEFNKDGKGAEAILKGLIAREQNSGKSSQFLLSYWSKLSSAYGEGNPDAAVEAAVQAVKTAELCFDKDSPELASVLIQTANVSKNLNKFKVALPLYKRALQIYSKSPPLDEHELVTAWLKLGDCYLNFRQTNEADVCYQKALKLADRIGDSQKDWIYEGLTTNRLFQGRYIEAEIMAKKLLSIREAKAAETSMLASGYFPYGGYVITSLNLLARVYSEQGRNSDATPLLERGLALGKKLFPENSSAVADSLDLLAKNYRALGREKEANKLDLQAKAINAKLTKQNP